MMSLGRSSVLALSVLLSGARPELDVASSWSFGTLLADGMYSSTLRLFPLPSDETRLIVVNDAQWLEIELPPQQLDAYGSWFRQSFVSKPFSGRARDAAFLTMPGRDQSLLAVLDDGGEVTVSDVRARQEVGRFNVEPLGIATAIELGDVDGDGNAEIFVLTTNGLLVYDLGGQLRRRIDGVSGYDLVIGQLDSDAALEVAASFGAIVDTASWTSQASFGSQPAFALALLDLDRDGDDEVVVAGSSSDVAFYDGATGSLLRRFGSSSPGGPPVRLVVPVLGGGQRLLAMGAGSTISLWNFDTGAALWSINEELGVQAVVPAQLDEDPTPELLFASGYDSTAMELLASADLLTGTNIVLYENLFGGYVRPRWGDVDGDGRPELVVAVKASRGGARLLFFDGTDLHLRAAPRMPLIGDPLDLALYDLDGDGHLEIVVAGTGPIMAFRVGADGQLEETWRSSRTAPYWNPFSAIAIGDVDADGGLEVIATARLDYSGYGPPAVMVFDAHTGGEKWSTPLPNIPSNPHAAGIQLVDLEGDGVLEIVCSIDSSVGVGGLYVIDGNTRSIEYEVPGRILALSEVASGVPASSRRSFWVADEDGLALYRLARHDLRVFKREPVSGSRFIVESGRFLWLLGAELTRYRIGKGADWTSADYAFATPYGPGKNFPGGVALTPGGRVAAVAAGAVAIHGFGAPAGPLGSRIFSSGFEPSDPPWEWVSSP